MQQLIDRLLSERGIHDKDAFLSPQYDARPDAFLLPDMRVAVDRIFGAVQAGEKIAVWHDYDCDGIPGGSLLKCFFDSVSYPVITHAAERSEGYGLNAKGIDALAEAGVSLIVTVDCGITEHEMVAYANAKEIDVIVTDHHLPSVTLPPALAVINPHRTDSAYPEKVLCGTGVAFKLVEAIISENNSERKVWDILPGTEKWLLDLVALATVADMVPLTGENRTLVKFGLHVLQKGRRTGLAALLAKEKIPLATITEDDIAFSVAPKINAASRMESPKIAVELLTTNDSARAEALALKLISLNKSRKLEGARVAKEVKARLANLGELPPIIVLGNSEWKPSLLGIAANNIIETYGKTVCLWGKDGGMIKGSCRSVGDVNVVELFNAAKDALTEFGGHEKSGGFSLTHEQTIGLQAAFENAYESMLPAGEKSGLDPEGTTGDPRTFQKQITETSGTHDGLLSMNEVTSEFYKALRALAPFGVGNSKPVFRFSRASVLNILFFGKEKEHARLSLTDSSGGRADAVVFFVSRSKSRSELELLSVGDVVDVDATLEVSTFAGRTEQRLRLERLAFSK